jgi:hypothetical protein
MNLALEEGRFLDARDETDAGVRRRPGVARSLGFEPVLGWS